MRKFSFIISLLAVSLSQNKAFAQSEPTVGQVPAQAATLHFYQSKAYGFLSPKYRVYADGKLVCKLGRNSHCQVALLAGARTFTAKVPLLTFGAPPALTLSLEPGRSYYLQGDIAPAGGGVPGLTYGFTEVVPNSSKLAQITQARTVQPLATSAL